MLHVILLVIALHTPHKLPPITVAARVQCSTPRVHVLNPFTGRDEYYCTK